MDLDVCPSVQLLIINKHYVFWLLAFFSNSYLRLISSLHQFQEEFFFEQSAISTSTGRHGVRAGDRGAGRFALDFKKNYVVMETTLVYA